MSGIVNDIKQRFKNGDVLIKLIYINLGVFIVAGLLSIFLSLFTPYTASELIHFIKSILAVPVNNIGELLLKPYTLITNMFTHFDIGHIAGNLLILYFLGRVFLSYFSPKQLLGLYLLGGMIGAFGLAIVTEISPKFNGTGYGYGASAAVMAIVIGIGSYASNSEVRLFGLFPIKLKWIAIMYVVGDIAYFYDGNSGGHLAHLIGALVGLWFATSFKKGKDITKGINNILDRIVNLFGKRSPKMRVVHNERQQKVRKMSDEDYNASTKATQAEVDAILDKISASGYDSLTKREKEILFKYSNKN